MISRFNENWCFIPQVLLEILSGLPPVDESRDPKLLVSWEDENVIIYSCHVVPNPHLHHFYKFIVIRIQNQIIICNIYLTWTLCVLCHTGLEWRFWENCTFKFSTSVFVFQMEMKDEIDDEEISLEDFIDQKMEGWKMQEAEKMYEVASQCLCEKKNKRPPITDVRHIF